MKNANGKGNTRRETLEQLADEGDEVAVSELWLCFEVDRRTALA